MHVGTYPRKEKRARKSGDHTAEIKAAHAQTQHEKDLSAFKLQLQAIRHDQAIRDERVQYETKMAKVKEAARIEREEIKKKEQQLKRREMAIKRGVSSTVHIFLVCRTLFLLL